MSVEIVPGEGWHVPLVAADVRDADRVELWAQARATPAWTLEQGLRRSVLCFTGVVDGEPACMFGVTPYCTLLGQGVPWLVGSNRLAAWSAQKALLALAPAYIAQMHAAFPLLVNAVHDENAAAKRWLRRLGFKLLEAKPAGPDRALFRPFYRVESDV